MKLDTIALILVILGIAGYVLAVFTGIIAVASEHWLAWIAVAVLLIIAYIMVRVILDRVSNKEDDYYDKNVEK